MAGGCRRDSWRNHALGSTEAQVGDSLEHTLHLLSSGILELMLSTVSSRTSQRSEVRGQMWINQILAESDIMATKGNLYCLFPASHVGQSRLHRVTVSHESQYTIYRTKTRILRYQYIDRRALCVCFCLPKMASFLIIALLVTCRQSIQYNPITSSSHNL